MLRSFCYAVTWPLAKLVGLLLGPPVKPEEAYYDD